MLVLAVIASLVLIAGWINDIVSHSKDFTADGMDSAYRILIECCEFGIPFIIVWVLYSMTK